MADWMQRQLEALDVKVKRVPLGPHTMDGQQLELPPVLFGQYGDDPKKRTILVYGHLVRRRHQPRMDRGC